MIAYTGLHERSGHVNGKRSWISTDNVTAVWYNPPANEWIFGTVEDIGKELGLVHSVNNEENIACPHEVKLDEWKWFVNDTWYEGESNEIQVNCQSKGSILLIMIL